MISSRGFFVATNLIICSRDCAEVSLISLHPQISPLVPSHNAQPIHIVALPNQFVMVSIRAVYTQLLVFQYTMPGIKGTQSRLLSRC
ncbi:hypothetical protein D3C76_1704120 [compost metagenome]